MSFARAKDTFNNIPKDFSVNFTLISVTPVISELQNLITSCVKNCFCLTTFLKVFCVPQFLFCEAVEKKNQQQKNNRK